MIPKIICFIFGHKRTWIEFTGSYGKELQTDLLTGFRDYPPIYIKRTYENCPRCGVKLKQGRIF